MRTSTIALLWLAAFGFGVTGCSESSSRHHGAAASTSAGTNSNTTASPVTSGGTANPTTSSSTPTPITPAGPAIGQWLKGDLHGHSAPYSQDADRQGGDPPGMCFFLAEQSGLDFYALTDHRTLDQVNDPSYSAQTLTILDGTEWGGTVHVGMVGISRQVPEIDSSLGPSTYNYQVQQAYDEVHRQGGAVILNHPLQDSKVHIWLSRTFDAVEVWNAYWNFPKGYKDATVTDVDAKVAGQGLAAIGEDANPEIRHAVSIRGGGASHQALKFWEAHLNAGRKKAIVGGGDRHSIVFPGLPTTRVFAENNSKQKIVAGIRAARTWVGADGGPELEYKADADGDGVFESIIGDSVPLNRAVSYKVRVQNAPQGMVHVVKNGQIHLRFSIQSNDETFTWVDTAQARSWTRVDVFEKVDLSVSSGAAFQLLAMAGAIAGQGGMHSLSTYALPLGFQVAIGTRFPTIKLPHAYDKILNFDRMHWGYSRGAITSPIWAE